MHHLARAEHTHPVPQSSFAFLFTDVVPSEELAGRDIHEGAAESRRGRRDRGEPDVRRRIELCRVGDGAGGDNANDLALDETFRLFRIFDLIADRNPLIGTDEFGGVRLKLMVREAAHRDGVVGPFAPRGQRQFQETAGFLGIFVEHLVEVAHAVQQDRVGMLLLQRLVLPQHRCQRRAHKCAEYSSHGA